MLPRFTLSPFGSTRQYALSYDTFLVGETKCLLVRIFELLYRFLSRHTILLRFSCWVHSQVGPWWTPGRPHAYVLGASLILHCGNVARFRQR